MRRKNQLLPHEEAQRILREGNYGVLALSGDENYPYSLPISYIYHEGKLYFHGAKSGHKIDSILRNDKASFCVVEKNEIIAEEYTTYFRSVIVFGKIRVIDNEKEKFEIMDHLGMRFAPADSREHRREVIERSIKAMSVLEMSMEHMTAKEAMELVRRRQKMENE